MNEFETQLISQLTRIADALELIMDNDLGSLAGIEMCLSNIGEVLKEKSEL